MFGRLIDWLVDRARALASGWNTDLPPLELHIIEPLVVPPALPVIPTLPTEPIPMPNTPQSPVYDQIEPGIPPKVSCWADAITQGEGAEPHLNNPGNLKFTTLTASWGATPGRAAVDGGHLAQFPTFAQGRDALCLFLILGCENQLVAFHAPVARTLRGFTDIYAGGPPSGYINRIVTAMGGNPDVQISTFLS